MLTKVETETPNDLFSGDPGLADGNSGDGLVDIDEVEKLVLENSDTSGNRIRLELRQNWTQGRGREVLQPRSRVRTARAKRSSCVRPHREDNDSSPSWEDTIGSICSLGGVHAGDTSERESLERDGRARSLSDACPTIHVGKANDAIRGGRPGTVV